MSNAVQSMVHFRPRVSLYDNPCPMFVVVQEPEIQPASNHRQTNLVLGPAIVLMGDSVKTERNGSHYRTTIERK